MKRGSYEDDPIAYRIAYSRLAQLLHDPIAKEDLPAESGARLRGTAPAQEEPSARVREQVEKLVPATPPPEPSTPPEPASRRIVSDAQALVGRSRGRLAQLGWEWVGSRPHKSVRWTRTRGASLRLAQFLDEVVEPATVVFYFSARLQATGKMPPVSEPDDKEPLPLLRRRKTPDNFHQFIGVGGEPWLDCYLKHLTRKEPEAPDDWRPPSPPGLGWEAAPKLHYRVHYNLACMFARIAAKGPPEESLKSFERAGRELNLSITKAKGRDRQVSIEWAERDPTLIPFQDQAPGKFREALKPEAPRDERPRI
jgi:hypothetical protein